MENQIKKLGSNIKVTMEAIMFQDGKYHIAYCPALNLVAHSEDEGKVRDDMEDAMYLFFDHYVKCGRINEKLKDLGWEKKSPTLEIKTDPNASVPYYLLEQQDVSKINIPVEVPTC